jgi:predicted KAP-like P-loop ATPase
VAKPETRRGTGHNPLISADQPLSDPAADALGYAPFAKMLAESALRGSPATGLVVGVYGEWGLGKTTLLNFVQHYAEADTGDDAPVVIRFNPWWSSGREDLLERFFSEFEQAVLIKRGKRNKLRKAIGRLGEAATNAPSGWAAGIGKTAMFMAAQGQPADLKTLKDDIVRALNAQPLRVIVLVDDIDRLLPTEMVDIFRMVRSVGDLPNVHYVLAFDRGVVAKALGDATGASGERYLEKIVQAPFTLPRPTATVLHEVFQSRLQDVLGRTDDALFDRHYWSEVMVYGVLPFLRTPRDIVRLINALAVIYPSVQNDVNPTDFVAIETLRVFAPEVHDLIRAHHTRFVGALSMVDHMRSSNKLFHEKWLAELGAMELTVKALVLRLFPAVARALGKEHGSVPDGTLRKQRRICREEVFEHYFRYMPGRGMSRREFLELLETDESNLRTRLLSLVDERVDGRKTKLREFLEMLHDELSSGAQVNSFLLNKICAVGDSLIAAMPTDFAFEAPDDIFLVFVVERLLERIAEGKRMAALREAIAEAGISSAARIAAILGGQHGRHGAQGNMPGERTIPLAADIDELEELVGLRIEQAAVDGSLWTAPRLVRVLFDWVLLAGADCVRNAVRDWTSMDAANMVTLIVELGSRSTSGQVMFDLASASELLDVDEAASIAATMTESGGLDGYRHTAIMSFQNAYAGLVEIRREQASQRKILAGILDETVRCGWFPSTDQVNILFESERVRLQALEKKGQLRVVGDGRYLVTSSAMSQMIDDNNARQELQTRTLLVERLQGAYRSAPRTPLLLAEISKEADRPARSHRLRLCRGRPQSSLSTAIRLSL